jgi:hypothetical protein
MKFARIGLGRLADFVGRCMVGAAAVFQRLLASFLLDGESIAPSEPAGRRLFVRTNCRRNKSAALAF